MQQQEHEYRDALRHLTEQAERPAPGIIREFWEFLRHNKKWWLMPILLVLALVGLLVVLAGTGAAPFIYPFF